MSLLLVAATPHKASLIPFLMLGAGFILLRYVLRLREQVRQQREKTEDTERKLKLSNRVATLSALLIAGGFIGIIIDVSRIPK